MISVVVTIILILCLWSSRLDSISAKDNDHSCEFAAIQGLEKVLKCPAAQHALSCPPTNSTSVIWCITHTPPNHLVAGSWVVCVSHNDDEVYTEGNHPFDYVDDLTVDNEGLLTLSIAAVTKFKEPNDVINCSIVDTTTNMTCGETNGIRLSIIIPSSLYHPRVLGASSSTCTNRNCTVTSGLPLIMCEYGLTNGVSLVSSTFQSSSLSLINITGHTDCNMCFCHDDLDTFSQFITNSSDSVYVFVNLRKSNPCQLVFDQFEFYVVIPRTSSQTTGHIQFGLWDSHGVEEQSSSNGFTVSVEYESVVPVFHSPLMPYSSVIITKHTNTVIPCNVTVGVTALDPVWAGPGVVDLNSSSCLYISESDNYGNCMCETTSSGGVFTVDAVMETVYAVDNGAELAMKTVVLVICEALPTYEYNFTCSVGTDASRVVSVDVVSAPSTSTGVFSTPSIIFKSTDISSVTLPIKSTPIVTTTDFTSTNSLSHSSAAATGPLLNRVVLSSIIIPSLLAAILFMLAIMIITCWCILRRPTLRKDPFNTLVDKKEFSREQLIFVEKKGEGEFGEVWKAIAPGIVPGNQARNVVAVKHVKDSSSWTESNILQEELQIMKTIEPHPNVVNLLGYCTLPVYSPVLIIMEFAEHGNLKDYLVSLCRIVQTKPSDSTSIISSPYDHSVPTELSSVGADPLSRSSTPVSSDEGCFTKGVSEECQCSSEGGRNVTMEMIHSERVTRSSCNNYYNLIQNDVHNAEHFQDTPGSIEKDGCDDNDRIPPLPPLLSSKFIIESALQIAKGMEHLEKMKCLHRDLAARNILIADGFLLKVSDFGLARDASDKDYYRRMSSRNHLPACWMAIESLDSQKIHTHKSDVWSFAVVLWEIHTYGKHPYGYLEVASTCESILHYLKEGNRLPRPDHCTDEMYELMTQCWDTNPSKRPSFSNIVLRLDQLLSIEHGYLALSEQQNPAAMIHSINDPACQLSINAVQSRSCSRSRSRSPFHILSHSVNSIPHVITPVPCLDDSTDSNQVSSYFQFASATRNSLSPFAIVSPFSNNSSETLKSQSHSHSQSRSHSPFPPPLSPFQIEPIINQVCSNNQFQQPHSYSSNNQFQQPHSYSSSTHLQQPHSYSSSTHLQQPHSYSSLPPLHSLYDCAKARSHSPNPVPNTLESSIPAAISELRPPHTRPTNLSLPRLSSHVTSSRSPSPRIMIKETSFHCTDSDHIPKSSSSSLSNLTANGTGIGTVTTGTGKVTAGVVYTKKPLTRT